MNKKEAFVKGIGKGIKNWAKNNREAATMLGGSVASGIPAAYLMSKNEKSTGGDKVEEFAERLSDKHNVKKPEMRHDKALDAGGGFYAYRKEDLSEDEQKELSDEFNIGEFDKTYLHTDSPTVAAHEISHNVSQKESPDWYNKLVQTSGTAGPFMGGATTLAALFAPRIASKTFSKKVLPGMAAGSVAASAPHLYEETQANVNAVREVAKEKGKSEAARGLPDAMASEATYLAGALTPAAMTAAHLTRKVT